MQLTYGQDRAMAMVRRIMAAQSPRVGVVAGFAGTGKTTVLRVMVGTFGDSVIITPTGKAALRVRESTGLHAETIHRWLYKPDRDPETGQVVFVRREPGDVRVPQSRLVLLDEASMVGPEIWKDVYEMCKLLHLHLILIGDPFQLAPVQPRGAAPFSVMLPEFAADIDAERVELTEILRQAADSPIIRASMRLRQGEGLAALSELPRVPQNDFWRWAYECYRNQGVIICHRNNTRREINLGLRTMMGVTEDLPQPGEPLLVLKNDYGLGVCNGEVLTLNKWKRPPSDEVERVFDKYNNISEGARFGAVEIDAIGTTAVIAVEEIRGALTASVGAIAAASRRWARREDMFTNDVLMPHLHANFGYGCTGHKCVAGDTLVETARGLQRIRDVARTGLIETPTGRRRFTAKIVRASDAQFRVETSDGYVLDATEDHGVAVWNGIEYARKNVCALKEGDIVRLRVGDGTADGALLPLPKPPAQDVRAVGYRYPRVLTPDLAELFGILVADGTIGKRGVIRVAKRHSDVVDRCKVLLKRCFGVSPRVGPHRGLPHIKQVEVFSVELAAWLRMIGGMSPNDKYIPTCVLAASCAIQARFLRGLFEDGTVNLKGRRLDHIELSNRSDDLIRTVQTMLLRHGIISGRRTRGGRRGYGFLYIYGVNARRFGAAIGMIAKFKMARLARPVGDEIRYSAPFSMWESELIRPFLTASKLMNLRSTWRLSRHTLRAALAAGAPAVVSSEKLKWHHTRVAAIRRLPDAPSYCVEVPQGGKFLQNGFDAFNSQGSQWLNALVVLEPSIRLREEEGRRWTYTAITRAEKTVAVSIGDT